jgi:hypothetical protein
MRALMIGLVVLLAGPAAANQPVPPAQAGDIEFMGVRLGTGLAEWKALAFPGRDSDQVAATCSSAPARTSKGGPSTAQAQPTVVCGYVAKSGSVDLPPSLPLTGNFLVRDPKYEFVGGRLSSIAFHTSIDAFNDLTTRFEARYGPASQTLYDDVKTRGGYDIPRVRKIWRLAGGSIEITDPTNPPTQLEVQFTGR